MNFGFPRLTHYLALQPLAARARAGSGREIPKEEEGLISHGGQRKVVHALHERTPKFALCFGKGRRSQVYAVHPFPRLIPSCLDCL
jgi:hypothetical protein